MEKVIFEFEGESVISRLFGFGMIFLFLCFGVSLTFKLNPLGIVIAIVIISFCIVLVSRFIRKVYFYSDKIIVRRFYGSTSEIDYKSIRRTYKNKEGFIPTSVYVLKYLKNDKTKKATFYCTDRQYEEVLDLFRNKNLKMKLSKE